MGWIGRSPFPSLLTVPLVLNYDHIWCRHLCQSLRRPAAGHRHHRYPLLQPRPAALSISIGRHPGLPELSHQLLHMRTGLLQHKIAQMLQKLLFQGVYYHRNLHGSQSEDSTSRMENRTNRQDQKSSWPLWVCLLVLKKTASSVVG